MRRALIVGPGRVGTALAAMGPAALVRRGEALPAGDGPIYVCTRNDDLAAVVEATPPGRRGDLVFVQNGMIEPWLAARGLEGCTQALLYFAVARVGDAPVDGGRTVAWGRWAEDLRDRLAAGGVACEVVDRARFRREMVEKLLWIAVFGVLCDRHGLPVGPVAERYRGEVDALAQELAGVCTRALGVALEPGLTGRLLAYSASIPDYRAAVKELPWRNGWLLAQEATPLHARWLRDLGHA